MSCLSGWFFDGNGYFGTLNLNIVAGQVIKSHGAADARNFCYARERALDEARNNVPQRVTECMAQLIMPAAAT